MYKLHQEKSINVPRTSDLKTQILVEEIALCSLKSEIVMLEILFETGLKFMTTFLVFMI